MSDLNEQRRQWIKDWTAELADAADETLGVRADELRAEIINMFSTLEAERETLADDEAIMRGVAAVRRMLMLRVGDQHDHASAFRAALVSAGTPKEAGE